MTFGLSFLKAASNLVRRIAFHCRYVRSVGLLLHVQSHAFFVFSSRLFRYRTPIGLGFFFRVSDYSEFLYILLIYILGFFEAPRSSTFSSSTLTLVQSLDQLQCSASALGPLLVMF
jgi:hypothetical protein